MSLSGHLKWGVIATLAVTLSGGCIPYPRERPGYIDLCKSEYEFSIDSPDGKKDIIIETYLYDHAIPGNYMPQKRSYFTIPFVQGPEAGPNFMFSWWPGTKADNVLRDREAKASRLYPLCWISVKAGSTWAMGNVLAPGPTFFSVRRRFPTISRGTV
ncbi:hypothetical protein PTT41_003194 [Cronobacter turicensis]|uniref:hypothetical protein n=1 Tax=Cronobacter turicensis TaxID=413502 RepID=UPI001375D628|nr:hypothetical protein [Cronobacter turicensis]EKM0377513.1 hypothetical protein [Cronobacter turicensis]